MIDLDVEKFFDSVPWDLIVKAVEAHSPEPWVVLYVRRWLAAPLQSQTASWRRATGGPRRGRRSRPCWRTCSCTTRSTGGWPGSIRASRSRGTQMTPWCTAPPKAQAQSLVVAIGNRMAEVGLRLHPTKTRIVYCKDGSGGSI